MTSRMSSCVACAAALGIIGSISFHSASVRSLGYRSLRGACRVRASLVHMPAQCDSSHMEGITKSWDSRTFRSGSKTAATGKKPAASRRTTGRRAAATDQLNLTDGESRIMPVAGGGFEQCYNAQAVVAAGSLLVIASTVVQAPNEKQQGEPMLAKITALPEGLGKAETLLGDNGYFSEANVKACEAAGIEPLLAIGRDCMIRPCASASPGLRLRRKIQRLSRPWPTACKRPRAKSSTRCANTLPNRCSASSNGAWIRRFLLRGLEKVKGEWSLVTMAWNLKRMFALKVA